MDTDRTALPRELETATGDRLLVREIRPSDLAAVVGLYERLDQDDVYRRFFTGSRPREEYFERLTHIAERGGCSIVVIDLATPPEAPRIVAEASVEPLGNGNGEIAVTVDPEWRGWMGPFLLGELRHLAASRGIANLEAEMLAGNRPMRALTHRCGEVVVPHRDWQTVRVVVASDGNAPGWPVSERPKVLVELQALSVEALADLVAGGYEVLACTGRHDATAPPCPMSAGHDCPVARDADVIVVAVTDGDERHRLIREHRQRHPEVPVVDVELAPGHGVTGTALRAAVERGLRGPQPITAG
jgi:RimJ/RimL family protein N-acetyltransferase